MQTVTLTFYTSTSVSRLSPTVSNVWNSDCKEVHTVHHYSFRLLTDQIFPQQFSFYFQPFICLLVCGK